MIDSPDLARLRYQRAKYTTRNPISRHLLRGFFAALERAVSLVCEERVPQVVIEFGCGEGVSTWYLRRTVPEARIVGFDLHRPSVEVAQHLAQGATFLVGDALSAPFHSGAADLVVMLEVLEHLTTPAQALGEAARVSRRWCIFSVPHEPIWRILNLARGAYWRSLGNTPGHINHWSQRSWRAFLLQQVEIVRLFTPLPWMMAVCRTR